MPMTKRQQFILAQVQQHPGITVAELAEALELHPNSIRVHLKTLVHTGHIQTQTQHENRRGRPTTGYVAATPDPAVLHEDMAALINALLATTTATPAQIAQAWAQRLPHVTSEESLRLLLIRLGFAPTEHLTLEQCPYTPPGTAVNPAICQVHKHVLREISAPHLEVTLLPLATDGACHIKTNKQDS